MKTLIIFALFSSIAFSNIDDHQTFFDTQIETLTKIKKNKYKNVDRDKANKASEDARIIAFDEGLSSENRSMGYAIHAAYIALFAKLDLSLWTMTSYADDVEKSLNYMKEAIALNPQNAYAVIGHTKAVYRAYEYKGAVETLTDINLSEEKKDAITNLERLEDRSNPDYEKYRSRILKID